MRGNTKTQFKKKKKNRNNKGKKERKGYINQSTLVANSVTLCHCFHVEKCFSSDERTTLYSL